MTELSDPSDICPQVYLLAAGETDPRGGPLILTLQRPRRGPVARLRTPEHVQLPPERATPAARAAHPGERQREREGSGGEVERDDREFDVFYLQGDFFFF